MNRLFREMKMRGEASLGGGILFSPPSYCLLPETLIDMKRGMTGFILELQASMNMIDQFIEPVRVIFFNMIMTTDTT